MNKFSDFNLASIDVFIGTKIAISKVLNKPIIVQNSRITDSKYPKNKSGKCLGLQINIDGEKHVLFTGSDVLISQLKQLNADDYPFATTIIKQGEHYEFT